MGNRPFPLADKWRAVGLLFVAGALNYGDRAVFSAVLPALRQSLHLSDEQLGILGSAFLWTYALCSPFAGGLADRYSRVRLVIWSLALWSLVTVLTGMATGFITVIAMRIALGITECLYLPAAAALIGDHHGSDTRGRALSLHLLGIYVGVVFTGVFAGFLAEHFGWRSAFWVLGGMGIVWAWVCHLRLPMAPAAARPPGENSGMLEALKYLVRTPSYLVLVVVAMLSGVTVWAFFQWLPLYFTEVFSFSLTEAGFAGTFLPQLASIAGLTAGGWISDRLIRRGRGMRMAFFGTGYLVAAPFLLFFVGRPGFYTIAAAISVFNIIRCLGSVNEVPIICDVVPSRFRSTAIGIFNTAGTLAGGIGILVTGYLKAAFGLNAIFAGCSAMFVVAAVLLFVGWRFFMDRDIARAGT